MTMTFRRSQFLFATFIISFAALSAKAQDVNDGTPLPNISRVCLWNADRATWKELRLKKPQIERLRQLRLLYPAVVNGQWVVIDDAAPLPDEQYWVRGGPNRRQSTTGHGAAAREKERRSTTATVPQEGLQNDVREVLTAKQLRNWARLCAK